MARKVRFGVVGSSGWADMMHLPSVKSHPQAELVAICGRNTERARALAEKYAIPKVYGDYREMIARGSLDAVVVSVPDDLHYDISIAAIDAGLHVICEKPLALTADQAKEMYEKAERAKVKHMTYFTYRWLPLFRYVHHLVEERYVGRCLTAELHYVGGWGRNSDYRWRFDRKRTPGVLGDMGSHMIDMARWLVGDFSAVCASLSNSYDRHGPGGEAIEGASDSARLLVDFANGGHGLIDVSSVGLVADRGQEMRIVLYGEGGTVQVETNWKDGSRVLAARQGEKTLAEHPIPEEFLRGIDRQCPATEQFHRIFTEHPAGCRAFVDAIVEDRDVSPSFYDGWKAQEVMGAAAESDRSRRYVSL